MRKLKWLALNSVFFTALYFGAFKNVEGAANIALFLAWAESLSCIVVLCSEAPRKKMKAQGLSVPATLSILAHTITLLTFAYVGWWATAVVYFFGASALIGIFSEEENTND